MDQRRYNFRILELYIHQCNEQIISITRKKVLIFHSRANSFTIKLITVNKTQRFVRWWLSKINSWEVNKKNEQEKKRFIIKYQHTEAMDPNDVFEDMVNKPNDTLLLFKR